jgi:hypothetical protein
VRIEEVLRACDGASDDAEATRDRILMSIGRRARVQRRAMAALAVALVLGTGTLGWAWRSGKIERARVAPAAAEAVVVVAPAKVAPPPRAVVVTSPAPVPAPAPAPPKVARTRRAVVVDRAAALYRRAHDLHFRGDDPVAALAAWDAYLAMAKHGELAVEARYNRALALVKLRRFDDARAALAPFAAGSVEDGYRQRDAAAIVDALDRRSR